MRKRVCFLAFILLVVNGYLIVLAYPGPPGPTWVPWNSRPANITAPNGVYLNVYVAFNLVRLANPNWNYRSYHWACASSIGNNTVNFEFKHDDNISFVPGEAQRDNQGYDENSSNPGVYERDDYYYSTKRNPNTVKPYTAMWSPWNQRGGNNTATAQIPEYTVPVW